MSGQACIFYAIPKFPGILYHIIVCKLQPKQGAVLSPILFAVYMDDLYIQLKDSGSGCHIGNHDVGSLGYADDTVLMAPSLKGLQTIVDVSDSYARKHDVICDGSKSQFLIFPSNSCSHVKRHISIYGNILQNVNEAVHLGHHVSVINKDYMSQHAISQFWRSFNIFRATLVASTRRYNVICLLHTVLEFMVPHYGISVVLPSNTCVPHGGNVYVKYGGFIPWLAVTSKHCFHIANQWRLVFNKDFQNSLWVYSKMVHQCWEPLFWLP